VKKPVRPFVSGSGSETRQAETGVVKPPAAQGSSPLPVEVRALRRFPGTRGRYPWGMVSFSPKSRRRWEAARERREIADLEQFTALLIALFGSKPLHRGSA